MFVFFLVWLFVGEPGEDVGVHADADGEGAVDAGQDLADVGSVLQVPEPDADAHGHRRAVDKPEEPQFQGELRGGPKGNADVMSFNHLLSFHLSSMRVPTISSPLPS